MNVEDEYLPPPPPSLRTSGGAGNHHLPPRRIAVQPPAISTAVPGPLPQVQSTLSPASPYPYGSLNPGLNTPLSPYGQAGRLPFSARAESPMSFGLTPGTMMEYNPQQWGRGGPTGGIYRPHATLTVTATPRPLDDSGQPLESPPPPYSPSPQTNIGQHVGPRSPPQLQTNLRNLSHLASEVASPASAITVITPISNRSRNETQMNFPPPPNQQRDRSTSRSRFGLSALTRGRSSDRSTGTNAIEALQYGTREALANAPVQQWNHGGQHASPSPQPQPRQQGHVANRSTMYIGTGTDAPLIAPAARRSASTGTMAQWTPGMPLPPPPSGPPPSASSRSASLSRAGEDLEHAIPVPTSLGNNSVPIIAAPTRRPPHRGTQLGPIPPTPAGYDEFPKSPMPPGMRDRTPNREPEAVRAAAIDTSDAQSSSSSNQAEPSRISTSSSWSGSLKREPSAKGIRERRSESRAAKDRRGEGSDEPSSAIVQSAPVIGPADLVLSPVSSGGRIARSGAMKKPRPSPSESRKPSLSLKSPPRTGETSTPPFSPSMDLRNPFVRAGPVSTKALPTPPSQQAALATDYLSPKAPVDTPSCAAQTVTVPDSAKSTPGSAATIPNNATRPNSRSSDVQIDSGDSFAISSIKRHQEFVRKETRCSSDAERLQLFAEYIVTESRIRRDQYSAAFVSMEPADVMDMTRNLWRTMQPTPSVARPASAVPSSASSMPHATRTDSMGSFVSMSSPMFGSQANHTPLTEPESPASIASSSGNPRDCGPWARHQPVLSPIPSMAMSTVPDEEDSRGRPASRWWESSAGSTGVSQRVERTKRESKFMGVHREALASLQWQEEPSPSLHGGTPRTIGEYPVEKTGWHDDNGQGPASTPRYFQSSVPATPDPHQLDVSRLVTLPPPYPRHYPAMANNHPDLAPVRAVLEELRDTDEVRRRRDSFNSRTAQRREQLTREAADRHAEMRRNIQDQVQVGQMNYAQAASAEEDFNTNESQIAQAAVRKEYTDFQPEVMVPLHALISEKITKGTACITQMCSRLSIWAEDPSLNQPQEEGDEQPELLEKLNLLKWLFEAREALYKGLDDLEVERNERYREVIMKPLRDSKDDAKLQSAQQFFDQDRQERKTTFEKAANKRYEEFAAVIEKIVTRGVEDQLSAFWDIAPGLSLVVQKVPEDLVNDDFELHIPPSELEENPQYKEHPLQHLYTLLTHAEKSAYQFIESQVNLMCLLHEAHTGLMVVGIRLMECQRVAEGEELADVQAELGESRKAEEQRLTHELKEKVETVESQWREGLGSSLTAVKEKVMDYLYDTGGWDESLLE